MMKRFRSDRPRPAGFVWVLALGLTLTILFSTMRFPLSASTAVGDLDTSFDSDGIAITDIRSSNDVPYSLAVQGDGKIVVAGRASGPTNDFALVRYNMDGSLDSTFGTNGRVTTDIRSSGDTAYSIVVQGDGKIVVAGIAGGPTNDFALARYNLDGSLDASFGPNSNGTLTTDFGSTGDEARSVRLQSDGKIVVAGHSAFNFAVARYNSNGILDTSFSGDGKVTTAIGVAGDDIAYDVVVQSDGKIVAVGYALVGTTYDFALARYNIDGSLDASFGTSGQVMTPIGTDNDFAIGVAIQSDGKIVAGGETGGIAAGYEFALARYNANGSLDTTFSGDGKLTTDVGPGSDYGWDVAVQGDGKIIVAGMVCGIPNCGFGLVRYNSDGSLDTTFSGDGKVTTSIGTAGIVTTGAAMALRPDGRIILTETFQGVSDFDFVIVSYLGDSANIALSLSDGPDPVQVGSNLVYSIQITNNGPGAATSIFVTDILPTGVTFVSVTSSQGSCSGTTTVTCDLGTINNAASATIEIIVTPTEAGTLINAVSVSSGTPDPDTNNNNFTAAALAIPQQSFLATSLPWFILIAVVVGFVIAMLLTRPKGPKMGR